VICHYLKQSIILNPVGDKNCKPRTEQIRVLKVGLETKHSSVDEVLDKYNWNYIQSDIKVPDGVESL